MPTSNIQQPHDLRWLKAQVNEEINRTKTYFLTMAEFIWGQFQSPSAQPVSDRKLNFRLFLNDSASHQIEAFEEKITGFLDEFTAAEGGDINDQE